MLEIKQFVFGPFGVNTYVIYDSETLDAMIVDPGMNDDVEYDRIDSFIADNKLKVKQIINTHLHIDHCLGDNYIKDKYGLKVAAHADDEFFGSNIEAQARMFGLPAKDGRPVVIDVKLKDGDTVYLGKHTFKVLHSPGHSPGGIVLYCADSNILIAGDSLFRESIGRTDLPGGDYSTLIGSLKSKVLTLPDETLVLSGHGPSTDIAHEKKTNPFLR